MGGWDGYNICGLAMHVELTESGHWVIEPFVQWPDHEMVKLLPCASAPSDEILGRGRVEHGVVVQYARIDLLDHVVRVLCLDEDFDFDGLLLASRNSRRAARNDGS